MGLVYKLKNNILLAESLENLAEWTMYPRKGTQNQYQPKEDNDGVFPSFSFVINLIYSQIKFIHNYV